jgi:hypothetical protein
MPNWRDAYQRLSKDVPKEQLRKLIEDVESAIFIRTTELHDIADSNGEFKRDGRGNADRPAFANREIKLTGVS